MIAPEAFFESLPFSFTLKPLLFGGKAMEYYGLREGIDYDFLIHKEEFRQLQQYFPEGFFINTVGDVGIRIGEYEFYVSQFELNYLQLEHGTIDQPEYRVAHLDLLLFLKMSTLVYEPENQKARQDLVQLMHALGVQPFLPESSSNA
jgi:hypothetical protein